MKPRHTMLLVAVLAMPAMAGGDMLKHQTVVSADATPPAFAAGQVLTLDASGRISPGAPQATDVRASLGDALSTSSEGLVEIQSSVPGGGVMVDLQGRFQNAMTLDVDENGNINAPCVTGTSDAEPAAAEVK